MDKLDVRSSSYFFTRKKAFVPESFACNKYIEECFEFAYNMSFGGLGKHRDHRSGGNHTRKNGEIFIHTFQGKLAEFAIYDIFQSHEVDIPRPDLETYELGIWDTCDFEISGKKLAVKSTKHFGQLFLLETEDWNENGEYKPNIESGSAYYDYFVLVRISPDGEGLMKVNRLLYANETKKDHLKSLIVKENWSYDVPGYINHDELVRIINEEYILPQGALLNGTTGMDAENYYVQAGDMHDIHALFSKPITKK